MIMLRLYLAENSCRLDVKNPSKNMKVNVMQQDDFKDIDLEILSKENRDVEGEGFIWWKSTTCSSRRELLK